MRRIFRSRQRLAVRQRLTPTLFDKLVADLEISGLRDIESETPQVSREKFRHYAVPKLDRFNEAALRATNVEKAAIQTLRLVEKLEALDDVQKVYFNAEFSDEVLSSYTS